MAEHPLIVLAGADEHDLTKLDEYRVVGGYAQLERARGMAPSEIIAELEASNLRGRGGAFFPVAKKMQFIPPKDQVPKPHYVCVNADESEPGTFKDREIMQRVPHRLIEGCLIAAYAIDSQHVFIYIRGEYLAEFEIQRAALDEARDAGLFDGVTIVLHRGAGAYICGEESGLLESLEGKRGQPRSRPPFPAVQGLYASPTLINNVETIATVPKVLELGGAEYAKIGAPPGSTGTRLFCVSGNVVQGGNYELPHGITIREVIYGLAGGIPDGRELKAVIPGGSSMPILTADQIDAPLEHDALRALDTYLGAAAVIVVDERCCMVQLGLRVAQFYMHESCGKCTPCREGTRWMVQILEAVEAGRATHGELDLLLDVCDRILGKCLCPLGDAAALPVASYVVKFRDEFRRHVDEGGCPFGGESSLENLFAPVDQHEHHPVVEEGVPA
ncbi:MAG: NADH-quinone oxidoreductase subunit NuoF [Actinomycetota bacterium]|nr:NADH-quinone oxidoreductase subunit NuoF [Actinomycetota bacterium]